MSIIEPPKNTCIEVFLVDDHPLIRTGIKMFLERTEHIKVIGEASHGLEAIDMIKKHQPDIVLTDIEMPKMGGIEFTIWLQQYYPNIKIVVLSSYDDDAYIMESLKAGANGYLLKNSPPNELIGIIEKVVTHNSVLDPSILQKVVSFATDRGAIEKHPSRRELQVLQYLATGKTNCEIGEHLHISSRTVQGHLRTLFAKLEVETRTEAVIKAISLKLIKM